MSDTSAVTVEVLALDRLRSSGRLVALASVEVCVDGVAIVLQGARVPRRADGMAVVEMPCTHHSAGDLIPAVALPADLEDTIARQVLRDLVPDGIQVHA